MTSNRTSGAIITTTSATAYSVTAEKTPVVVIAIIPPPTGSCAFGTIETRLTAAVAVQKLFREQHFVRVGFGPFMPHTERSPPGFVSGSAS